MSLQEGLEAEEKASSYLQKEGYSILARNFHSKFGEIDIIALQDNTLHFCEVKFSKKYDPITRITASKMAKIIKTINNRQLYSLQLLSATRCIQLCVTNGTHVAKSIQYYRTG